MAKTDLVAGIDIGGTTTSFGLIDRQGNIIARSSVPTEGGIQPGRFVNLLYDRIMALMVSSSSTHRLKGFGIGAAGANSKTGIIEDPPNLSWKGKVPLASLFTSLSGLPALVTNDANAAAAGEMNYGAARRMSHFAVITIGTGIGSGVVIDGKIITGERGLAGEFGHTRAAGTTGLRRCGCGSDGCLETYTSVPGLLLTARELLDESGSSGYSGLLSTGDITGELLYQAALKRDRVAIEAYRRTGTILGTAIANLALITDPEAIILFGGMTNAGKYLFDPVMEAMNRGLLARQRGEIALLASGLDGDSAGILGAASLFRAEMRQKA